MGELLKSVILCEIYIFRRKTKCKSNYNNCANENVSETDCGGKNSSNNTYPITCEFRVQFVGCPKSMNIKRIV